MVSIKKNITRKIKRFFIDKMISSNIKEVIYREKISSFSEFSYAQEGEDMILSGICENLDIVQEGEMGFYVDIGAHHPLRFSNTYHFYQKGWNGINIDAMPNSMNLFKTFRVRDINLEIPISDTVEEMNFYSFKEGAFNTFDSKIAELRIACNEKIDQIYKLTPRTLESVLDEFLPKNQVITFMSVDVEGSDMHVLRSNNWNKYKPKIVLVEDEEFDFVNYNKSKVFNYMTEIGYVLKSKTRRNLFFILE